MLYWFGILSLFALVSVFLINWTYKQKRPTLLSAPVQVDPPKIQFTPRSRNRILITGGTGGLGFQLVNVLLDEHSDFVQSILILDMADQPRREDPRVHYQKGDITNYQTVLSSTKNIDVVFHVASLIDLKSKPRHWPRIFNINVIGATNVIEACVANGVSALVYTGSLTSRNCGTQGRTEDTNGKNNIFEVDHEKCISYYGKTKCMAEKAVTAANARGVLRTASILPTNIFGYRDRYLFDQFVKHIKEDKSVPALTTEDCFHSWSYNVSTARLHVLCAQALMDPSRRDQIGGQSFFHVDWNCVDRVGNEAAKNAILKASKLKFDKPIYDRLSSTVFTGLRLFALFGDWLFDGQTKNDIFQLIDTAVIDYTTGDLSVDGSKAERLLNFKPVSMEQAFRETAANYFPPK